jgi:hypothetical protein
MDTATKGTSMPRMHRTMGNLIALIAIAGAVMLWGCPDHTEQATVADVNNEAFTFPSGAVFHPALANSAATLTFTNNASTFTLSSPEGTAAGTNTFGSCILAVTTSTYPLGAGPQATDVLTLNQCDFDNTDNTLTVSNGSLTATSAAGVASAS